MSTENTDNELSLDDIFSRDRQSDGLNKEAVRLPFKFLNSISEKINISSLAGTTKLMRYSEDFIPGNCYWFMVNQGAGKSSLINCGIDFEDSEGRYFSDRYTLRGKRI